jgi:WD40 repeat protein
MSRFCGWCLARDFSDLIQESPTLDLANDCSRFVTRHFGVITASSSHIYHSALVLTPRESLVRKLYKLYSQPFVRVVCGLPGFWDPSTAAATSRYHITLAIWSSCNRFIAISLWQTRGVDILDSATLQRLQSLEFPQEIYAFSEALAFSPDCRMLTSVRNTGEDSLWFVVSWDLQTGGVISVIEWRGPHDIKVGNAHIAYSANGKRVGVLSRYESSTVISIYDVVFGIHIHSVYHGVHTGPDLTPGASYVYKIWTHGGSLRISTPGPTGIAIWEVGFTPGIAPAQVESVSLLDGTTRAFVFSPWEQGDNVSVEFHPASCRLAFIETGDTLLIWDARVSKFLLRHTDPNFYCPHMTFSSDGHFFVSTHVGSEAYLWKETPAGYTLFGKFKPSGHYSIPRFSPNGGSIITFGNTMLQLWQKRNFTTIPATSAQSLQRDSRDFILEFLPGGSLAAVTRTKDTTVTVFDPKSGVPQLTIDTSMEVYGLKNIENNIVIIGGEKAITWNIPGGNFLPGTRMNVEDSIQTIDFGNVDNSNMMAASISHDLQYIALARHDGRDEFLDVHNISTGQTIRGTEGAYALWFAPGESQVWCASVDGADVFTITQDSLEYTRTTPVDDGTQGCPWGSLHGYKVTYDWWILGVGGKRLMMLPPLWQSKLKGNRIWNEKFLALVHGELPELVILELEP